MDLKGTTDLLSIFDVTQMLSINEATGMLRVENAEGRGYLYFQAGNIINAMNGVHAEGEEAARRVFAMKHASYAFTTDLPSVAHRISVPTQNLMMEIARVLDEESDGKDGEAGGLESRVQETQEATRHLREIFTKLDSESRILSLRSPDGFGLAELLDAIRESSDSTLYLRDGAPPEVHAADRVIPLAPRPVTREGYEGLRQILFRESEPLSTLSEARTERVLSFGERGRYLLDAWKSSGSEVLTIRRLPDPSSLADSLPWAPGAVDALLKESGSLVLLTGPDGARLGRIFEATCAHLARSCPGPFLGFARRWTPGWGTERATIVRLSTAYKDDLASAGPLIERLAPALVAVEDSDHAEARSIAFHALQRGTRVLMGVAAAAVPHCAFRILDGVDATRRDALVRHLGFSLTGVLSVPRNPSEPAKAWKIQDATRTALLRGDLAVLTKELASTAPNAPPIR